MATDINLSSSDPKMVSQGPGPDAGGVLFRPFTEDTALSSASDCKDDVFAPSCDVRLEDGMPLPKCMRDAFPRRLKGTPIQEIDPFYYGRQTFLVISANWTIHRFSALKSMWLFSPFNRLRWFTIRILTHSYYRYFMILALLLLFISTMHFFEEYSNFSTIFFNFFFTIEMLLKIVAYGFLLTPLTYLRRTWNWLDFLLNLAGWTLEIFVQRLNGFLTLRVFRIIHLFTYSRISFSWMFRGIIQAKDLLIYSAYIFLFFTLVGLQLFQGQFMNKCVLNTNSTELDTRDFKSREENWLTSEYGWYPMCGNKSHSSACPANYVCHSGIGNNPNYGYTSFDSFGWAALQTLRLMTKDYWENLFFFVHAVDGPTHYGFLLTVMVYGGYLLTNFFVAHIAIGVSQMIDILEGRKPKLLFRTVGVPVDRATLNNCALAPQSIVKTDCDKEQDTNTDHDHVVNSNDRSLTDLAADRDDLPATELNEVDGVVIITNTEAKNEGVEKDDHPEKDTDELTDKKPINPIVGLFGAFVNLFCEWNCSPCCVKFQNMLSGFVSNRYFNLFICIVITLNIVIMALDHHLMPWELAHALYIGSLIVSLIYIVEAMLKILAFSPKHYFNCRWNVFDFIIVVVIVLELALENVAGLSILRAFRVVRVFRLARWWPGIGLLVKIVNVKSLELIVFAMVMASIGQTLFSIHFINKTNLFPGGDLPRWNYVDYHHSLMSVLRMLGGEWIECLWDCMLVSGWTCIPFTFIVVVFGHLLIFNLFVVMVFSSLQSNNLCETENDDEQNLLAIFSNFFRSVCPSRLCPSKTLAQQEKAKSQEELCEISNETTEVKIPEPPTVSEDELIAQPCCWNMCSSSGSTTTSGGANSTSPSRKFQILRNQILVFLNTTYVTTAYTLFLVVANFASMETFPMFSYVMNFIVLVVFAAEIILKLVGRGCKVYFSNGWSAFEFTITFLHVVALILQLSCGKIYFPVAFRPLKLIIRLTWTRVVISSLLYRLSVLVDAVMACGLIWLIFAIVGVQLFGGRFYHCEDLDGNTVHLWEAKTKQDCIEGNITWVNSKINFDNVGNAFFALLQVATFKGWIGVLNDASDNRGVDNNASREINLYNSWYFVIFLATGVLCTFTLLITAYVRKTNDQKRKCIPLSVISQCLICCLLTLQVGGYLEILMTPHQIKVYALKKESYFKMPKKSLPEPTWGPRPLIYRMVTNRKFEITIIIFLIFNAIALSVSAYDITERLYLALDYVDIVFIGVFAIEITFKLIAFGKGFFSLPWNNFEFVITVFPIILLVLNLVIHPHFSAKYLMSPGWFGLLRMVRLVRWIKWIRRIVHNIWVSLPAYNNIGLLFLLITFAYAQLGIVWFREARLAGGLDEFHNYKSIMPAWLTMIQLVTLAGWDSIYDPLSVDPNVSHCCVVIYLLSFILIVVFILLEVGVVILLENYHRVHEKYRLGITDQELEDFVATWHCYDQLGEGTIPHRHLYDLICILPTPLQIADLSPEGVEALAVPRDKDDRITFTHTLRAILADVDDERKIARPSAAVGERSAGRRAKGEEHSPSAADRMKNWCRGCFGGGAKKLEITDDKKNDSAQLTEQPVV